MNKDLIMKKLLIGLTLLTSMSSFATTSIIVHEDCRVKNNTLTITNSDGSTANNSPETILGRKGFQLGTSSDQSDTLSDLMQLNYSSLTIDGQVTIELVAESGDRISDVFVRTGTTVSDAVEKLPECRKY